MTFTLRDARLPDLEAITAIYRESVVNGQSSFELIPPSTDEMKRRFTAMTGRNYPYIVAEEDDGVILGYAYAAAYRERPAYRWTVEDSIYIDKNARGRDIGKALLVDLIARCENLGFRQMIAIVGGPETGSVALHKALGFEHIGTMQATGYKFGQWLDTVVMQLPLGKGRETDPDMKSYPGTLFEE